MDKSNDDLFIDWTKDGDSITNVDSRIKQTNSDSLKIRELLPEDTGFYLCKAVNGFGSVEVGINLIVLGEYSSLQGIFIGKDVNFTSIESTFFSVSSLSFQLLLKTKKYPELKIGKC